MVNCYRIKRTGFACSDLEEEMMKKLIHICLWALAVFCLAGCSKPVPDETTV